MNPSEPGGAGFGIDPIEVREGRAAEVGGLRIARVLPTKRRRTIGPWCFVDLMSPDDIDDPPPMEVGPHPHIGLSTVTWLLEGAALHTDSLGTEQMIRPGQLNLMTAGNGIAHAELGIESTAGVDGTGVLGAQMWLAQPNTTRTGSSRFQHLADLPTVEIADARAKVLIGALDGTASGAAVDWPTVGLELTVSSAVDLPVDATFEHGVVPLGRTVKVDDVIVEPGSLAIVPLGRSSLRVEAQHAGSKVMVVGGAPLDDRIQMWWNFVARTRDEITEAWKDWQDHNEDRFGPVPSQLARIDAPRPHWLPDAT